MKKIKPFFVCSLCALVVVLSVFGTLAATIYTISGYSFTMLNNSEIALCGWDNRSPELSVPASINTKKLVEVDKYGLANNVGFSTLDFSQAENLSTIGYGGFMNCTGISNNVVIPIQVHVIGFSAFENCTSLPNVIINADVASIQSNTFFGCTALERVEINGYTSSIGYQSFANCPNLSYVQIPNSVTSISAQAFTNSPNVVIGCYYDSYAYHFAFDRGMNYTLLDNVFLGDANGDGSVNINDVTMIQRYLAELETLEGIYLHAADVNQDGTVDIADATAIQMYLAEYEMDYPIGEIMTQ